MASVKKTWKQWEERLLHSTRVWRDAGLTGQYHESDMSRAYRYYRGVQDNLYHGEGAEEKFVTANIMFRAFNTLEGKIAARAPRVMLFPTTKDAVAGRMAFQSLLNYYVRRLDMAFEVNSALRDSWFAPFGIIRHGYTPIEEYEGKNTSGQPKPIGHPSSHLPDTPWIQRKPIWDVRIDSVSGDFRPGFARWYADRTLVPQDELERNPNTRGKGINPTLTVEDTIHDVNDENWKKRKSESADFNSLCEVWTIWDRVDREWMQWSPGLPDKYLREPAPWPIPWEELPYSLMATNWQGDDPFPVPLGSQLVPIQEEINNVRTMMSVLARSIRRMTLVNGDRIADEDLRVILDQWGPNLQEWVRTKGGDPREAIHEIQAGHFPNELLLYLGQLENDVRELMGQSRMDRGERINVESAAEANAVQSGSNESRDRHATAFERFWVDIIRKFGTGLRAVMDDERIVPILGPEDTYQLLLAQQHPTVDVDDMGRPRMERSQPFMTVKPDDIQGEYHYDIRVGTTMPRNSAEERAKAVAWLEIAGKYPQNVDVPDALRDAAIAFDKDPVEALQSPEQIQKTQQLGMQQMAAGMPQATGDGGGSGSAGLSPLAIAAAQGGR